MGTVTFLSMLLPKAIIVSIPDRNRSTLLSLARRYGVPLRCSCGRRGCENCASCAVKVAAVRPSCADTVSLSAAEKATLWRVGRLTPEQYRAEALTVNTPLWRLACQYIPSDEDIWVAF